VTVTSLPLGVSEPREPTLAKPDEYRLRAFPGLPDCASDLSFVARAIKEELTAQLVFWGANEIPCDFSIVT
jgi:hypothetical protein